MQFEMPETLTGLDADALESLRRAAEAAFNDVYGDGKSLTDEDLSTLETLAGNLEEIDAAHAAVVADEERRANADALAEKIASRQTDADDDEDDSSDADADATDDATDDEDESDEDRSDEEVATDTDDNADESVDEKEPAMTAGGRRKTKFSGLPTDQSKIPARKIEGYSLSPHVPGYTSDPVDSLKIAEVFTDIKNGSSFGNRTPDASGSTAIGIASIDRAFPEDLVATDEASLTAAIDKATDERDLEGGSLVAAGGWCAPSETLYSFLGIPAASDLLSLPEVNVDRGGVRFPVQPDFGALYSDPDLFFHYTEAEMETDYTKPCFEIPCTDFEEVRLDALGLCITAGILQRRAYPELIQVYVDGIMKNHQHRLSALSIEAIRAGSGDVNQIPADSVGSAYGALLNSVELAIVDIRLNQRIPDGTALEVILPVWAKAVLRADIAYRRGADVLTISDEQIRAHFAARNANVQYVSDYQVGGEGQPGGSSPLLRLPETVEFIVYPAGTWFRALQNVIEVGVMYDKAQLQKNRYTQLFTEDAFAVAKRGAVSRLYSVPLRADGSVGPALPLDSETETPAA